MVVTGLLFTVLVQSATGELQFSEMVIKQSKCINLHFDFINLVQSVGFAFFLKPHRVVWYMCNPNFPPIFVDLPILKLALSTVVKGNAVEVYPKPTVAVDSMFCRILNFPFQNCKCI